MARKRLADLLREEAKKPADAEEPQTTNSVEQTQEASPPEQVHPNRTIPTSTQAGLEDAQVTADIDELKNSLEKVQKSEAALQQQLAELKIELDEQKKSTLTLKKDLEKSDSLKAELEQAKKTVLQLAEANNRLKQELEKSLQTNQTKPNASTPPSTPSNASLMDQKEMRRQQASALAHPIFPNATQPGQLSNQDLGWVD